MHQQGWFEISNSLGWSRGIHLACIPHSHVFTVHHFTVAESELAAMSQGIRKAITLSSRPSLVLFADSRAALTSLLDPRPHPAQSQSIRLITALCTWLSGNPNRHLLLRWCPSHSGIGKSETVDAICKPVSANYQPPYARELDSATGMEKGKLPMGVHYVEDYA